ncbi:hypothetical protein [Paraburkholderia dilworthii]|uniref:Uncharacterized protein n=1 Tax=Paraburkholderia dilworthii TaxID=948106 RepID=A0ABW9D7Y5_9BURK
MSMNLAHHTAQQAVRVAINDGAPLATIAHLLNDDLAMTRGGRIPAGLIIAAIRGQRPDVLDLLLDRAAQRSTIRALGAVFEALDRRALNDRACAIATLAHATPAMLNREYNGGGPRWWYAFTACDARYEHDLHDRLALLREAGADLDAVAFAVVGHHGPRFKGRHGEALRAFVETERIVKRIDQERAVLRQAAAEATEQPTTAAARGRRRL